MAGAAASAKLEKYRAMRDFDRTSEPTGEAAPSPGRRFVIQQHAARRMHYDLRLELDGVLLSWSVPRGPSLSPTDRRLAVRTEDHPLDYAEFEGVIPAGEYGGGTVVVWDRGTWQPEGDARDGLAKGKLTFTLRGDKLLGRWHLVRTRSEPRAETWLLFKGRDDAASDRIDIVASEPASVLSGRTLDEIAAAPQRVWSSNRPSQPTVAARRAARITAARRARPARRNGRSDRADLHALVAQLPLGFRVTNLDKVMYPEQGITKGELIAYLAVVADWALPHLARRPLTLVRCPEGLTSRSYRRSCFYQKKILPGAPSPIQPVSIVEAEGGAPVDYMQIHDMPGLVALAQLGALEIHTWGAHADAPELPDLLVFDLDPDVGVSWERVALAAFELRRRLHDADLESFVKTTGGKGLHVVAPLTPGIGWDELQAFSKAVVEAIERDEPEHYTTNPRKLRRKGKIFLDYLRNARGATFIAPYSPRARAGAPVALPIGWEELAHGVDPATFTTATVPRRLAALVADPWQEVSGVQQAITARAWRAIHGKPPPRRPAHTRPGGRPTPRPGARR